MTVMNNMIDIVNRYNRRTRKDMRNVSRYPRKWALRSFLVSVNSIVYVNSIGSLSKREYEKSGFHQDLGIVPFFMI